MSSIFGLFAGLLVGGFIIMIIRGGLTEKVEGAKGWFAKMLKPTSDPLTPGATGKTKWAWTSPALVIVSFALLFILIAIFFPALWEWLYGQGKVFGLLVITVVVMALATRYKLLWWLVVIMGIFIPLGLTSFPPNPLEWRQPTLAKANQATAERQTAAYGASKSPAGRSARTSRVTTQTIIAKPGVYSNEVSIPGGQNFNIQPEGKIRARTASGKVIDDWPGRHSEMEHGRSLLDGVFQFMSLEEREVKVVVEWEPK
ncbi:MAG: hypothetical protein V1704_00840 [Candidatus Vogelbacteria bacterium]